MKEEFRAVLAGVPLLSPAEQHEFFSAVKTMQNDAIVASLATLVEGAAAAPVDKRVARYVALRDARAANTRDTDVVDKAYKAALEAVETSLIADAHAQGVTGFKTDAGTTYLEEKMMASIADDNAFYNFVRESGDLDFFERRIKVSHIKEFQEANGGTLPPGLNVFRELSMKVRRSS